MLKKVIASLAGSLYQREASPTFVLQDGVLVPNETLVNARHHNGKLVFDQGYENNKAHLIAGGGYPSGGYSYPVVNVTSRTASVNIQSVIEENTLLLVQVDAAGNIVERTGKTVTTTGTVIVDHTKTHDGYGSIRNTTTKNSTNASGYLKVTYSSTVTTDWTLEFWVKYIAGYNGYLVSSVDNDGNHFAGILYSTSNNIVSGVVNAQGLGEFARSSIASGWHHFAIVRKVSNLTAAVFLDGNISSSGWVYLAGTSQLFTDIALGADKYFSAIPVCIENLRLSGIARYTSNFTPPERF